MLKIIKGLYICINVIVIIALITIHFFIKDKTYDTSLLFYALPLPIIVLIILGLTIFLRGRKRKYNLIIACVLLIIWLNRSFRISFAEDIKETDLEIVFWNASRENSFEDAFIEHKSMPDVLVLTETNGTSVEDLQLKYPDYFFYKSSKELQIFSKTPLLIINEDVSNYTSNIVNFKTAGLEFYAIDVTGSTDVPRSWELEFVNSTVKNTKNTIILGDFNVPYESMFLKTIKENYTHFFAKKGNGFRETWFWNLPLLSLDHIWISKDLKILKSEKANTFKSDHCMIKTVVSMP